MSLNLTTIALAWVAGSVVLLPLMIVTVRLAVIPLVESITRSRPGAESAAEAERLTRLEEKVGQLARELEQLLRGTAARRDG